MTVPSSRHSSSIPRIPSGSRPSSHERDRMRTLPRELRQDWSSLSRGAQEFGGEFKKGWGVRACRYLGKVR